MFANSFISSEIFPLKKSDSCDAASILMGDFKVKQLPIVENQKVIGFVTEKTVLQNLDTKVESVMQTSTNLFCIKEYLHVFEILQILAANNLSSIAVLDEANNYKGVITANDIAIAQFNNSALTQVGSIITLQMPAHNYSLGELARISESNDIKILHVLVQPLKDLENHIQVSLKFNSLNLKFVKQSFERFGYQIIYANNTDEDETGFNDRLNWLIKYINT